MILATMVPNTIFDTHSPSLSHSLGAQHPLHHFRGLAEIIYQNPLDHNLYYLHYHNLAPMDPLSSSELNPKQELSILRNNFI